MIPYLASPALVRALIEKNRMKIERLGPARAVRSDDDRRRETMRRELIAECERWNEMLKREKETV